MGTFKVETSKVKTKGNTVTSFEGVQLYKNGEWVAGVSKNIWEYAVKGHEFAVKQFEALQVEHIVNQSYDVYVTEEVFNNLLTECLRHKNIWSKPVEAGWPDRKEGIKSVDIDLSEYL